MNNESYPVRVKTKGLPPNFASIISVELALVPPPESLHQEVTYFFTILDPVWPMVCCWNFFPIEVSENCEESGAIVDPVTYLFERARVFYHTSNYILIHIIAKSPKQQRIFFSKLSGSTLKMVK